MHFVGQAKTLTDSNKPPELAQPYDWSLFPPFPPIMPAIPITPKAWVLFHVVGWTGKGVVSWLDVWTSFSFSFTRKLRQPCLVSGLVLPSTAS